MIHKKNIKKCKLCISDLLSFIFQANYLLQVLANRTTSRTSRDVSFPLLQVSFFWTYSHNQLLRACKIISLYYIVILFIRSTVVYPFVFSTCNQRVVGSNHSELCMPHR